MSKSEKCGSLEQATNRARKNGGKVFVDSNGNAYVNSKDNKTSRHGKK